MAFKPKIGKPFDAVVQIEEERKFLAEKTRSIITKGVLVGTAVTVPISGVVSWVTGDITTVLTVSGIFIAPFTLIVRYYFRGRNYDDEDN